MNWFIKYRDGTMALETGHGRVKSFDQFAQFKPVYAIGFFDTYGGPDYWMEIPEGATPFARRRHAVSLQLTTDGKAHQGADETVRHILGWKMGEQSRYFHIAPDGVMHESDSLE